MTGMTGRKITILFILAIFSVLFFNGVVFAQTPTVTNDLAIDENGIITGSFTLTTGGLYTYAFVSKDEAGLDQCDGGLGGLTGLPTMGGEIPFDGLNVYTDGGIGELDCTNAGFYYLTLNTFPNFEIVDTFSFYYDGTSVFPTNQIQNPNLYSLILQPLPYGTTTASTTIDIQIRYKVNNFFDFSSLPAFNLGFRVYDAVTNELELEYIDSFAENTNTFFTYSTTTVLSQGSKIIRSYIENAETGVDLAVEDEVFFNVITNTYLQATGLNNPRANPSDLTQIDCDTFDIGCQFQKAITFLFVPSQDVLNRYNSLWQQIRYKVPFGYVTVIIEQLRELDDTATPAFDLGDIPFLSTVFNPIRDALSVLLWGVFAIYFYRHRLTKLDI